MPPVSDPFAGLADPTPGPCDYNSHNGSGTLSPGVYCGGLSASGSDLTFEPGTYYIVDGNLNISSINNVTCNCAASGSGVTFVLTGTTPADIGTSNFSSINNVSLRSPSDAAYDYPGMLIYVDRDSPYATSQFSSIDNVTLNGTIYAPSQKVNFSSIDYTAQADCAQTVAFRVQYSSIDGFGRTDDCEAYGAIQVTIGGSSPKLVQ